MRVISSMFRWSCYTATVAVTMMLGAVASVFAGVEMLVFIVTISA